MTAPTADLIAAAREAVDRAGRAVWAEVADLPVGFEYEPGSARFYEHDDRYNGLRIRGLIGAIGINICQDDRGVFVALEKPWAIVAQRHSMTLRRAVENLVADPAVTALLAEVGRG